MFILCCSTFLLIGGMRAFVLLGFVFHIKPRDCLRNDLFCVEWDVKPGVAAGRKVGETKPKSVCM